MRIDARTASGSWEVYDGRTQQRVKNVLWVDTDLGQWCTAHPDLWTGWGNMPETAHYCERIEVDEAGFLIVVNAEDGPEVPFEVHNARPIDKELCMAEVRAMCGGSR